ncbi:MAG: SDR family oxidoreductase [Burkholderiaceae bacterium]|nr:SDR family oxidoreductase [Burkholderiaceae bacterium]
MRLKDKVAIVTGGGSGFGAGIVRKFVAEGARVVIADRNLEAALDVAAQVGEHARALRVDVSDAVDVRLMMEAAELHFGRLDILVNNAGVTHLPAPLEDVGEADFDRIVAVNMKAIYYAMREVVPRFKAREPGPHGIRGVVLNVASTAGVSPRPRLGWYNASKGWVITATPEDLGNAACFLCSDEASMITGVAMEVDGGRCI